MEYAMRIIISVGEQNFCSWLFHELQAMDRMLEKITNAGTGDIRIWINPIQPK
jgi:hypothetical protein